MRDKVNGGVMRSLGAQIVDKASGSFKKFLIDAYGRVVGTTPVVAADLEALIGSTPFPVGVKAGTGVTVSEIGGGVVRRTRFTLAALAIAVTDANAYGSQKIYDFPEGRILLLGATCSLAFAVTTDRDATINNNAALKFALGSAAASAATLATTMVDIVPKTSKTLNGAVAAYTTAVGAALAAAAQFDGTGTPMDAYLNLGFETGTDIDADGTVAINGTIDLTWVNLGDY